MTDPLSTQRAYYNAIAGEYDSSYSSPYALLYRKELFADILKGVALGGIRVLDMACGGGQNSLFFKEHEAEVVGLDISDAQCAIFRRRFTDSAVVTGSMTAMGFADASFDMVVTESLHHSHPHLDQCLAEVHRVLKPGGRFLLWEPECGSAFDRARKLWYRLDPQYFQDNEASIDIDLVLKAFEGKAVVDRLQYGGNLAHLFVLSSMHFRIPPAAVKYYARPLMAMENMLNKLNSRLFSMWVLCVLRKEASLNTDGTS
ncbi:class I SAM-dependent methyltransferase [Magnetospirillum sulfuroxidans]|uniref:Class I SAM-dependent methyltransferase n=1 Tax=Magnetospirillum sulfuroxidans TaxID=611300 RepID=A0ABS5IED2_9PROT|nr:class I SAM-dependent methyltransferase [Magnetospirillum sulfuroxidans]MBR9972774.1 class I SAM-dependent methyltransferase [Magnetospirillum sulfuroxidans]